MLYLSCKEARHFNCSEVSRPYGPRDDRYVWAGHSCRTYGGGQERIGTKYRFACINWQGRNLGTITAKAWASPLACPLP